MVPITTDGEALRAVSVPPDVDFSCVVKVYVFAVLGTVTSLYVMVRLPPVDNVTPVTLISLLVLV